MAARAPPVAEWMHSGGKERVELVVVASCGEGEVEEEEVQGTWMPSRRVELLMSSAAR